MASTIAIALVNAADKPSLVLDMLQQNPNLASMQDDHGYSLLHAAASYGQQDLLRALVNQYHVKVDLMDEDGETALFHVETIESAKILVEELHASLTIRSSEDGKTARERFAEDEDFPEVATYLRVKELEVEVNGVSNGNVTTEATHPPPRVPDGITVDIAPMAPEAAAQIAELVADPEIRERIQRLVETPREFTSDESQEALRGIIEDAMRGVGEDRDVRQRTH